MPLSPLLDKIPLFLPKPDYSLAQVAGALQINWGGDLQGHVKSWGQQDITYSMPATVPLNHSGVPMTPLELAQDEVWGMIPMTETQKAFAREAFELWDDLIPLNLNESTSPDANITLAYSALTDNDGTYTETVTAPTSPGVLDHTMTGAHVWCSADPAAWPELTSANMGYANRGLEVFIHEIGHSLGLTHPGNYDASDATAPTYLADAVYKQDTQQYTVMSYFAPGSDGAIIDRTDDDGNTAFAATPLLHDIVTIQAKYGADMTTRTGDTVYGFHSNAGRGAFDFNLNQAPVIAIWDAGGNDTLDCSGFNQNQNINLNAGTFSDVGPLTKNVAIAYGVTIENAIGGSGDDTITGNAVANRLEGGAGDDKLDGGAGADVMIGGTGYDDYWVDVAPTRALVGAGILAHWDWIGGDQVIENANEGFDTVHASCTYTLPANVEGLILTGNAAIDGYGNELNNVIYGNDANNRLEGYAGNDVLDGRGGADTMVGGTGDDTYYVDTTGYMVPGGFAVRFVAGDQVIENAGEGHDTVIASVSYTLAANVEDLILIPQNGSDSPIDGWGNELGNTITGNEGANRLMGFAGNDVLLGHGGDDVLIGGAGADLLDGGRGDNAAYYDASPAAVTIDLAATTGVGGDAQGDLLYNIQTVVGSAFDDVLIGDAAANRLFGGDGNDGLTGGAGPDRLDGGAGEDTAHYETSPDAIQINLAAGAGLGGDAQGDVLIGIEDVIGSSFGDVLTGDGLANRLSGGGGNDLLIGGAGADVLDGGAGEDTASYGSSAAVQVNLAAHAGLGADAQGDVLVGIENVAGSAFGDVLTGDGGFNKLFGDGGDDFLIGGAGPDLLEGGMGVNTASYETSSAAVRVDLVATTGSGGDAQQDILHDIQNVIGSGFDDLLIGSAGANRLLGGDGNDGLAGGGGADVLDGGSGINTAYYDTSANAIQINLAVHAGLGGDAQGDVLINIQNVVGSNFGDVLTGDAGANIITGGLGADLLTGGGGNDLFVFHPGEANGDTIVDFDGAGAVAGDQLLFSGYGAGATFTHVDATHWEVDYNANTQHDLITLQNGAAGALHPSDYVFV